MSVSKAKNDVDALVALRDRLALEIDMCDSQQVLTLLSRQFMAVVAELADLKPAERTRVDEIAEKYSQKLRAIRSSDSSNKASAKGSRKSG